MGPPPTPHSPSFPVKALPAVNEDPAPQVPVAATSLSSIAAQPAASLIGQLATTRAIDSTAASISPALDLIASSPALPVARDSSRPSTVGSTERPAKKAKKAKRTSRGEEASENANHPPPPRSPRYPSSPMVRAPSGFGTAFGGFESSFGGGFGPTAVATAVHAGGLGEMRGLKRKVMSDHNGRSGLSTQSFGSIAPTSTFGKGKGSVQAYDSDDIGKENIPPIVTAWRRRQMGQRDNRGTETQERAPTHPSTSRTHALLQDGDATSNDSVDVTPAEAPAEEEDHSSD
ncbi:hypothetical protein EIP91_004199 [Steccherinum ochraceum]|uniref:Uncharacterized protein n=1 Tax=Steccherinum ochraceum TaxID=92696 RepID=A0A4R0RKP2_9APHY|nr:hypothetical protein EIP91_004199 [Steccherinum ochraceum]